jgi:hypothetical protein
MTTRCGYFLGSEELGPQELVRRARFFDFYASQMLPRLRES